MSRWQRGESSSSSSSSYSDEEEYVSHSDDDEEEEEESRRPTKRQDSQTPSRRQSQQEPRRQQQEPQRQQQQQQRRRPQGSGIPRRWIYDRVDGTVRNAASKPPCFLCYPPPMLKACPYALEENAGCVAFGRCGTCVDDDSSSSSNRRTVIGSCALVMNVCGLLVTIFAALALAQNDVSRTVLTLTSFAKTDLQPTVTDPTAEAFLMALQAPTRYPTVSLDLGLQAVLVSSSSTASPIPYDEFCDTPGMEQLVPPEDCNVCADVSLYLWIGMLVAILAYLPTVASDCLRLHSSYDVNCQKTVACFWSLISLAGYGLVYHYFEYVCLASFFRGPVMYSANGIVVEEGESTGVVKVDFEWKLGTGQICLYVGFFLKAIDLLCNCCLVTPAITRSRKEQWEYERLSEQSEVEAPPRKRENSEEEEDSSSSSED